MNFSILSSDAAQLTEPTSIALAQQIQAHAISTSLSPQPIVTTFVTQGRGAPLLLLHGFDSSVFEFRRLQPLLAEHFTTWAVDLLGFGFGDRPLDVALTPTAIKTHLYYTWKTLIDQPVVLVGASMGGAAAIDFALTYPDAVQQLVLIDSAGFARGPDMSKFMLPGLGYLATEFLRRPGVRRSVSLKAYADRRFVTPDAELCASLHLRHPRWQDALIDFTKRGGYILAPDKISQISQPTLIIWGESDRILGTADAAKFRAAIAHSTLVWIANCGHVPHLEKPEETAHTIHAVSSS